MRADAHVPRREHRLEVRQVEADLEFVTGDAVGICCSFEDSFDDKGSRARAAGDRLNVQRIAYLRRECLRQPTIEQDPRMLEGEEEQGNGDGHCRRRSAWIEPGGVSTEYLSLLSVKSGIQSAIPCEDLYVVARLPVGDPFSEQFVVAILGEFAPPFHPVRPRVVGGKHGG